MLTTTEDEGAPEYGGEEEPDSDAEDAEPAASAPGPSGSAASGTGTKRVGRRKINVQLIQNERHRAVTFAKRKGGLIKKAAELSILCDAEVAVVVASKNQKMTIYSSKPFEQIIKKYHSSRDWREISTSDIYPFQDQHGNASCETTPNASDGSAYSAATRAARTGGHVVFACRPPMQGYPAGYPGAAPMQQAAPSYMYPGAGMNPAAMPMLPYGMGAMGGWPMATYPGGAPAPHPGAAPPGGVPTGGFGAPPGNGADASQHAGAGGDVHGAHASMQRVAAEADGGVQGGAPSPPGASSVVIKQQRGDGSRSLHSPYSPPLTRPSPPHPDTCACVRRRATSCPGYPHT